MTISVAVHAWSERSATLTIILMARPVGIDGTSQPEGKRTRTPLPVRVDNEAKPVRQTQRQQHCAGFHHRLLAVGMPKMTNEHGLLTDHPIVQSKICQWSFSHSHSTSPRESTWLGL